MVGKEFQVLVRINDLRILAGDAKRGQLDEALAWGAERREALMAAWTELNERD